MKADRKTRRIVVAGGEPVVMEGNPEAFAELEDFLAAGGIPVQTYTEEEVKAAVYCLQAEEENGTEDS